jgi:L-lactate dehydrogenase complex protein LldF
LPSMLRAWRERDFARGNPTFRERAALKLWAYAAKRPGLYHAVSGAMVKVLASFAGKSGRLSWLPFASAWTRNRDLAAPEGKTFHQLYAKRTRG